MSLTITVDGVTLNNRVRLRTDEDEGISGLTSAADGSGSSGGIVIDDPNHDLVLQGWQTVVVEESACSRPRLFTGFIGDRTTTHGKYPTAGGRQVNVTINDQNALLSFRLITGSDGKRPVESRTARLAWLLGSDYLDGIVFDTGFIVPSGTSDFDVADYRRQYPRDVLDDVLGAFQVAFAFWDDAASKVGLFYDTVTATTYDSTLSISNDPSDTTSTCIAPYIDAELMQDPSGVYSLEDLTYTGGELIRSDATTAATFFPSPYLSRGEATDRSRIGKPVTASDYVNALLAQGSVERETVTCTIRLPATQVGLIDAGMRVSVKFTHLDGYETFVYTRVTSRVIREVTGRRDLYEVQLVLNQRAPIGGGGGGGGSNPPPTTFPPGGASPSIVQTGCGSSLGGSTLVTFPNPIAAGDMLVAWITSRGTSTDVSPPDGTWTTVEHVMLDSGGNPNNSPCALFCKIADSTEDGQTALLFGSTNGSSRPKILGWELAGVGYPTHSVQATIQTGASSTLPALTVGNGIAIAGIGAGSDDPEPASLTPNDHFYVEAGDHFWPTALGADYATSGGSVTFTKSFTVTGGGDHWAGAAAFFPGSSAGVPLAPGQPNARPEVVTMSGADGTTLWPFADGTLRVFVDNIDETGAVTAQDGAAGTFTLGFIPQVGEEVRVEYVGR